MFQSLNFVCCSALRHQCWHAADPVCAVIPGSQLVQLLAPPVLYVPALHALQCVAESYFEKYPAGQDSQRVPSVVTIIPSSIVSPFVLLSATN